MTTSKRASAGKVKSTPVYIYFEANAEAFFKDHQQAVDFFKTDQPHEEVVYGVNRSFKFSSFFEKDWQGDQQQQVDKGLIFYVAPSIFGASDGPNKGKFSEDELGAFVRTLSGGQESYRVVVVHFNPPTACAENMVQFDSADFEFDTPELNEKNIVRVAITARNDFKFTDALKHKMLACIFSLDAMASLIHSGRVLAAVSTFTASLSSIFSKSRGVSSASQGFTKEPSDQHNRTTRCSLNPRGTIIKEQVRLENFDKYSQLQREAAQEGLMGNIGFHKQPAVLKTSEAASASGVPGFDNASGDDGQG